MGFASKNSKTLPPPNKPLKDVEVIKFDPTTYGIRKKTIKSSADEVKDILIDDSDKSTFDKQEDKFDKQVTDIYDLLKTVEDFNAKNDVTTTRSKYVKDKLVSLGVQKKKDEKMSFQKREGMKRKQKEIALKESSRKRDLGLLTKKKTKKN